MPAMIDEAFEALRELVLHEADAFDENVLRLFTEPAALALTGVPVESCKLALLSVSLWAETCDDHPSFIMEDFNELCSDIVEEALCEEGRSDDELALIARSLLENTQTHGMLLGNLAKAERDFEGNPSPTRIRKLLAARMALGRYDACLPCLDRLPECFDRSPELRIHWCLDMAQVLCQRLPHRPELGERFPLLLQEFPLAFQANAGLKRCSDEELVVRWIRCHKYYLFHLENRHFEARSLDGDAENRKGLDPDRRIDYIDPDFAEAEAETVWPLIRSHDALVLRHIGLFSDPSDADIEPIQRDAQERFYEALEAHGFEVTPAADGVALH